MEKKKFEAIVPIEQSRYEELLWKEHIYDLKHEELTRAGYVSELDSILFGVPAGTAHSCSHENCTCGKVATEA